ncbi:ATP-binding protein [Paenibacillus sp. GCM10023252]|uniref:ATP-binding protein n=1 Tax=Paenibacillus sp. GCM10023252 TaxID=3252649 RepID=UPI003608D20C
MVEELLLNLFIIKIPLVLLLCLRRPLALSDTRTGIVFGLCCGLTAAMCMMFPIQVVGDYQLDFRYIPLGMSMMFAGPLPGMITFILAEASRSAFGLEAMLYELPSDLILVASVLLLRRYYKEVSLIRKLWGSAIVGLLAYILCLFNLYFYMESTGSQSAYGINVLLGIGALRVAVSMIIPYLMEKIILYNLIQHRLLKAERLNMVSELAASIAHEVRNPLTVVRGFLQIMRNNSEDEKSRAYMNTSIEELDRAEYIISDYLNMAKHQDEKSDMLHISEVLTQTVELTRSFAVIGQVELILHCEKELYANANKVQLQQVFINLLKNAIEAMPRGGEVEIFAMRLEDQIVINFSDNGEGMTPDQLRRLGTSYYTTKSTGTGLGLVVCMRIIHEIKGTLQFFSEFGQGTRAVIKLPAADGVKMIS